MPIYYTLMCDPTIIVYAGKDKYENEDLIRWGWPEDIWFHVDAHSSAHLYCRFPKGSKKGMDDLTPEVIEEVSQLTKANSIEGCKLNNVRIVYTPWSNLKKTNDMEVGQIGFHSEALRRYFTVAKKDNMVLKHHEKTKTQVENADLRTEREQRDAEVRRLERMAEKEREEEAKRLADEQKRLHEQKHYTDLMAAENMSKTNNNNNVAQNLEDDFM